MIKPNIAGERVKEVETGSALDNTGLADGLREDYEAELQNCQHMKLLRGELKKFITNKPREDRQQGQCEGTK